MNPILFQDRHVTTRHDDNRSSIRNPDGLRDEPAAPDPMGVWCFKAIRAIEAPGAWLAGIRVSVRKPVPRRLWLVVRW